MLNETHRAPPRYKISDFFSSLLGTYLHLPRIRYTVPEGIMQNSKAEKLRKLASKRQIVRAKDARELGIH